MATTVQEIRDWLYRGKDGNYSHMLIVCDTFDYEDYPVYVSNGEDINEYIRKYNDSSKMSSIMEIYSYSMSLEEQLNPGARCWNTEAPKSPKVKSNIIQFPKS